MRSRGSRRDEEELQEELVAEQRLLDDAAGALTPAEQRGILEALASIEAGRGLPFEEVMQELENFEDL